MLSSGAMSCKAMHPFSCLFNKESNTKILISCICTAAAVVVCGPGGLPDPGLAETVVIAERKINGARFSTCSQGV